MRTTRGTTRRAGRGPRALLAGLTSLTVVAGCGLLPSDGLRAGDGNEVWGPGGSGVAVHDKEPGDVVWLGLETVCSLDDETRILQIEPEVAGGEGTVDYFLRPWSPPADGVGAAYEEPTGLVPVDGAQVSTRCASGDPVPTQLIARVVRETEDTLVVSGHRVVFHGPGGRRHLDLGIVAVLCGDDETFDDTEDYPRELCVR
ncbi:hypothetical protein [Oerskovia flava]|uniref:hypothetical protein n=1 Tax=Oerskovia flava TaxID=2986422 RepID=UPI00223ED155|nr:hypothetical protein [Oerskovia sp. JB1-3-2]